MAWRIQDSVIRGEIDNRTKGVVRGRIWLHGIAEPIVLELTGNAHADLAGCLLRFENPLPLIPMRTNAELNPLQCGRIGDLTASRKVRVFDIPFAEACAMIKRGEKPPEHIANSLYLEWFSEANGRVVIEGADWKVDISAPAWRLTPDDEQQRAQDAADGMAGFMQKLTEAVEPQRHDDPEASEDWDEFDWETYLRASDARAAKYAELLEKYRDSPDAEERIDKEMGWDEESRQRRYEEAQARGEDVLSEEEMNASLAEAESNAQEPLVPDPHTEGVDWVRTGAEGIAHPLQHRCTESAMELWHACNERGLTKGSDPDLCDLLSEFQITGAKLAGALHSLAYGRGPMEGGFIVACLKRALGHLHAAQAALAKVAPKNLVPEPALDHARRELFGIREGILALMKRFRETD